MKILTLGIASLLLGGAGLAGAHPNDRDVRGQYLHEAANRESGEHYDWDHVDARGTAGGTVVAPELQPASAMAAFTLLAGGLLVLRGKSARKSKD